MRSFFLIIWKTIYRVCVAGLIVAISLPLLAFLPYLYYHISVAISPNVAAEEVIKGEGLYPPEAAYHWGDRLIQPIRDKTNNFDDINGGNALPIAMVLTKEKSSKAADLGAELYSKDQKFTKLAGAVILAKNNKLPDTAFSEDGYLSNVISNFADAGLFIYDGKGSAMSEEQDYRGVNVAATAAGYAKDINAVPYLIRILEMQRLPYVIHAIVAEALGDIGDKRAIIPLQQAMKSPGFYAIPEAFDALLKLKDDNAVPLATQRISPDIKGKNSGLIIDRLEKHTGQSFGFDRLKWETWWQDNHSENE